MLVLLIIIIVIIILLLIISLLVIGIYQKNTNEICISKKQLKGKTVLVTGGTTGMGLEMARDLTHRGARVIIASPFPKEGDSAIEDILRDSDNNSIVFKLLDLASFESVRNFVSDILKTEERIDILINNAGVLGPRIVTQDGLNFVTQVNYYGAFLLTILLLPLLKKSGRPGEPSRIINVSSASYILGRKYLENTFLGTVPPISYFISKLYIVSFTRELAKKLKNYNVVVNNADPGAVGTNLFITTGYITAITVTVKLFFWVLFKHPWQGAQTAIFVALDKKSGEVSGEYFKNCQQVKTAAIACDEKFSIELWKKSVKLVKLTDEQLEKLL